MVLAGGPSGRGLLIWELKSERAMSTPDQQRWLLAFNAAGVEAGVVRPSDMDRIRERLAR